MKALRTKAAAELDNPKRWHNYLRPWFDVEKFQSRINDRVGLNRDGRPIIRLVWGQDVEQHVFGELMPRYWTRRLKRQTGFTWWTVPRWMFERRIEPEQFTDAWNATRYSLHDPTEGAGQRCEDCNSSAEPVIIGGKLYCRTCGGSKIVGGRVIDKGPPPKEYYEFFEVAAEHEGYTDQLSAWPACCARQFYTDRSRCWGTYRSPSDYDLVIIERAVQLMNADKHRDPYTPLTVEQLRQAELASNMQIERSQELFENLEREILADFLKTYPYPGAEIGASHFSDVGPAMRKGEARGIIDIVSR